MTVGVHGLYAEGAQEGWRRASTPFRRGTRLALWEAQA